LDREPALVDKQIFPRLLALAERGWSSAATTDWESFEPRLAAQLDWLRRFGIAYYGRPIGEAGAY
jgi:hexosaminidase